MKPNVDVDSFERLTADKLCFEGCVNILQAFLTNLTSDFRLAYYGYIRDRTNKESYAYFKKIRDLFCSDYFFGLTGLDGTAIVEKLEAQYDEELKEGA